MDSHVCQRMGVKGALSCVHPPKDCRIILILPESPRLPSYLPADTLPEVAHPLKELRILLAGIIQAAHELPPPVRHQVLGQLDVLDERVRALTKVRE